jgi:hypothetical protein
LQKLNEDPLAQTAEGKMFVVFKKKLFSDLLDGKTQL